MLQGGSEIKVRASTHCQYFRWVYFEFCCKICICLSGLEYGLEPLDCHPFWLLSSSDISKYVVSGLYWDKSEIKSWYFF